MDPEAIFLSKDEGDFDLPAYGTTDIDPDPATIAEALEWFDPSECWVIAGLGGNRWRAAGTTPAAQSWFQAEEGDSTLFYGYVTKFATEAEAAKMIESVDEAIDGCDSYSMTLSTGEVSDQSLVRGPATSEQFDLSFGIMRKHGPGYVAITHSGPYVLELQASSDWSRRAHDLFDETVIKFRAWAKDASARA